MNAGAFQSLLPLALVLLIAGLVWAAARRDARNFPAAPQVPVSAAVPHYPGAFGVFRRHYHGDYGLGRSYWVNTLLVSLFAPLVGVTLLPLLYEKFPARYGSAGFLLVTGLGIVAWFWAVAGTWASANKHVQRGGKAVWVTVAKCVIVLGVLRMFADVGNMMPTLQEHMRVASGAQLGSRTEVELRADRRSVLLSGGINDGSADQLEKALQMAPTVSTVVLNSEGGWIREGQLLAGVIRRRGLNTYVEGYCASACTIAFLAGAERAAAPNALIGFHASRSVGSAQTLPTPAETAQLRKIYRQADLPESFIRQALDTPHEAMWHPPHALLLAAGVLTRKSLGGETASMATAVRSREALAAEFKKTELFAILAARAPKDFDDLIEATWNRMLRGATDADVMTSAHAQLAAVLPRFLPLARDETLIAYQALMQEQLEALRDIDVPACVERAFPSGKSMVVFASMPADLKKRELALITTMLREADPARAIHPGPQAVEQIARRAAADMSREQGIAFSEEAARTGIAPAMTCDAAIQFFSGLNTIALEERGRSLRMLYSANW